MMQANNFPPREHEKTHRTADLVREQGPPITRAEINRSATHKFALESGVDIEEKPPLTQKNLFWVAILFLVWGGALAPIAIGMLAMFVFRALRKPFWGIVHLCRKMISAIRTKTNQFREFLRNLRANQVPDQG